MGVTEGGRRGGERDPLLLEREIERILRFPDDNPNPVLRIDETGLLLYANPASAPIREAFGAQVGERLGTREHARVRRACASNEPLEVEAGVRTFAVRAVQVPELGFVNLYGTDITGAKVVERFPGRNPNPVFRIDDAGTLLYANRASERVVRAFGTELGGRIPDDVRRWIVAAADGRAPSGVEFRSEGLTFALHPVRIPEFGFINVYGTDVTAAKAMDKFPDENPNPVLRLTQEGVLAYANPAAAPILASHGLALGERVPDALLQDVRARVAAGSREPLELACGDRLYALHVVEVYEYSFINLYGRDITSDRALEHAHRENERLLLNILPADVAERLRNGATLISDPIEDAVVVFADIVDFTLLSATMQPSDVVEMLNEVFGLCDALVDRHGLEKVKTIGDAYMAVGGLSWQAPGHVERAADLALALVSGLRELRIGTGLPLDVRVGVNVGPAMAGVIGHKKFIYDVWGDTVNVASRMESHGLPGRIQVTDAVRDRLEGRYRFEPRGVTAIRGKGPMTTWFLLGRA